MQGRLCLFLKNLIYQTYIISHIIHMLFIVDCDIYYRNIRHQRKCGSDLPLSQPKFMTIASLNPYLDPA